MARLIFLTLPRPGAHYLPLLAAAMTIAVAPAAAMPDAAEPPDPPELVQPFDIDATRRMAVPVMVGEHGPFSFLVDTGAERSVISRELASRLDLRHGPPLRLATLSGPAVAPSFEVAALSLSDLRLPPFDAPALAGRHLGAAGLIGIDILQNHRVLIDFRRDEMRISPSRRHMRPIIRSDDAIIVAARRRAGRLILSDARIGGRRVDVIVDTGAQTSIGNPAMMQLVIAQRQHHGAPAASRITSVTGASIAAEYLILRALAVEGIVIRDLTINFTDSPVFRVLGLADRPAVLLGMDAMQLFDRVEIDYSNARILFDPAPRTGPDAAGRG